MYNVCTLTRLLTFHHYVFRPITRQQIFTFNARLRTERSAKIRAPTVKAQFRLTVWRRCGAEGLSKGILLFWHCSSLCSTSVDFSKIEFWPFRSPKYPTVRRYNGCTKQNCKTCQHDRPSCGSRFEAQRSKAVFLNLCETAGR